jgi:hypothetical protein
MVEHESMVGDLLYRGRNARMNDLMARLARAFEGDGEVEIFVPCTECSAPVERISAADGRCPECNRAG